MLEDSFLLRGGGGVDALVRRVAKLPRQIAIKLSRVVASARCHFCGEQPEDDPVLVRRPDGAITAEEGSAGAFLASEPQRPVQQSFHKPLETDRDFDQPPLQACGNAVDHAAAYQSLSHACFGSPLVAMAKQV